MEKISINDAADAVIGFLSVEVAKVANLRDRFLMFAALGAVKKDPSSIVNAYRPMLRSVGVIDDEGMVSVQSVKAALEMAFSNVPRFDWMGFTFTREDAAEILRRMGA